MSLERSVRFFPVNRDGKFLGFRLRPGTDRTLLTRLGVRPSDIITEVNGVRLDSPTQALEMLQAISGVDELNITVLRGSQEQNLIVKLDG